MNILHAGMQRTGTNFINQFINLNWGIVAMNTGNIDRHNPLHKHFRIQDDKQSIVMDHKYINHYIFDTYEDYIKKLKLKDAHTILMYKEEDEWLESIKKWALQCKWISNEVEFEYKKNAYLNEYRKYYQKWNSFNTDKIVFINHTNMMSDFDTEVEKLFKVLGEKDKLILPEYVNLSGKRDYKIKSNYIESKRKI